ncbi:protein NLP2-like protein [Carex littledalei]|uniref:Protein NLP2-like protein n=1 Tax=Carex littledalei TaxID=544730 RepID=A0A833RLS2_9POAL|nr:protein NLP2-like protein [Carex littledalei]
MDSLSPSNQGMGSPFSDDPFFLSALLNFDSFSDQFPPNELGAHQVFGSLSQLASPASHRYDNLSQFGPTANPDPRDENRVECTSMPPKPITGISLPERMLEALSLFKESSYSGILAQVWLPVKQGDNYFLTTSDQPFLLDQVLSEYREISRAFVFRAKEGLPGRVFTSGMPEWTTDVIYYKEQEFIRREHAINHEVHGSMGVPVFDPAVGSCVAVLELVTKREKADFDVEMDSVCKALQAVNLSTTKPQLFPHQSLTKSQKLAFAEILDVLRAICHAHMLPLALTWIPIRERTNFTGLQSKTMLQIHEPACYANDPHMQEFLHACTERMLEPCQGIAGKALESNVPFFSSDVRDYSIRDYPLAHHARKSGLRAAVAVRLRSSLTESDDYVLEFFLPVTCTGCEEQQLLLNNLSGTMQRICKSLRTVSQAELSAVYKAGHCDVNEVLWGHSDGADIDASGDEFTKLSYDEVGEMHNEKAQSSSTRNMERKRSTAEKNISLSVLQKYFSGSLKDAAKSLGVCPTTLKRICRQHGIARWPSRKINKVNRSLKKIQHVINSVQGVEGGAFKYDPAMGCLVTGYEPDKQTVSVPKIEQPDYASPIEHPKEPLDELQTENLDFDCNGGAQDQSHPSSSGMTDSSSGSASSHPTFKKKPNCEKPTSGDNSSAVPFVTVKASYKDDTVRFKFVPSVGYEKLSEEIEKRFKLLSGSFQIKYKDDEEEWVNLSNDLDLLECVDVIDSIGSRNVKLLVREAAPCAIIGGSSVSSCLLMES